MKALRFIQTWATFALLMAITSGVGIGFMKALSYLTPFQVAGLLILLFSLILAIAYTKISRTP